ncbi:MAG: HIT family protein [Anaerolineae bacterium]
MEGCLACDLAAGRRELPGGTIYKTAWWVVEHTVGPLPVGTLIVKPLRHVTHIWELTNDEAAELGPLLQQMSSVIARLTLAEQVYVCLWSHAGWEPGHIHFVLQPVWRSQQAEHPLPGPLLQAELFRANLPPDNKQIEAFAERARRLLAIT